MDMKAFDPIMKTRPEVNDIFFGTEEFIIGRPKENYGGIIEVCVTRKQCIKKEKGIESIASKGKLFQFSKKIKKDISVIDKTRENAIWIVEEVEYKEELPLIHSVLPESYRITARRLRHSKYDPEGEAIQFHMCGRFENTLKEDSLEIIGNLEK